MTKDELEHLIRSIHMLHSKGVLIECEVKNAMKRIQRMCGENGFVAVKVTDTSYMVVEK